MPLGWIGEMNKGGNFLERLNSSELCSVWSSWVDERLELPCWQRTRETKEALAILVHMRGLSLRKIAKDSHRPLGHDYIRL